MSIWWINLPFDHLSTLPSQVVDKPPTSQRVRLQMGGNFKGKNAVLNGRTLRFQFFSTPTKAE